MKFHDTEWLYPFKRRLLFGILAVYVISVIVITSLLYFSLRDGLEAGARSRTRELGAAVKAGLRSLMMTREPNRIQHTLENLAGNGEGLKKVFILDRHGRIVYSSDRSELGRTIDRAADRNCRACHESGRRPSEDALIVSDDGREILRHVMVIYNDEPCHGCHAPSVRINGKLIIDRSQQDAHALIVRAELIVLAAAGLCLLVTVPVLMSVLSRGLDRYIGEIVERDAERSQLYNMIGRLSRTIDLDELKGIIVEIFRDALEADTVEIVFPKERNEFRAAVWSRTQDGLVRKKIDASDPLHPRVAEWLQGRLLHPRLSHERQELTVPVMKGGAPLALVVALRSTGPFRPERTALVEAMSEHVAVALENARRYLLAITDDLTRLYSQRHFALSIEKAQERHGRHGVPFALLLLDLDNFNRVNESHGYEAGDAVLAEVAQVIRSTVRDEDLPFRYSGELFAVLLAAADPLRAAAVAERIRWTVADTVYRAGDRQVRVTISIGCAACPDHGCTAHDLYAAAERRLAEAKRSGKNRVIGCSEQ